MTNNKYFWLKLKNDFFERDEIKIIENMQNGKDYILFYLKLLCKSTSSDGMLRFNETIPYNDEMLSIITNTNVDIVRQAIKVFYELKMIEILDDGTYFMKEVEKMLGSESKWAEYKRNIRELDNVQNNSKNCPIEIEIEKEKELDIEKESDKDNISMTPQESKQATQKTPFIKPTYQEVKDYLVENNYTSVDARKFIDYYEKNGWTVKKNGKRVSMKNWKNSCLTWYRNQHEYDILRQKELDIRQREIAHKERIEEAYIRDVELKEKQQKTSQEKMQENKEQILKVLTRIEEKANEQNRDNENIGENKTDIAYLYNASD